MYQHSACHARVGRRRTHTRTHPCGALWCVHGRFFAARGRGGKWRTAANGGKATDVAMLLQGLAEVELKRNKTNKKQVATQQEVRARDQDGSRSRVTMAL